MISCCDRRPSLRWHCLAALFLPLIVQAAARVRVEVENATDLVRPAETISIPAGRLAVLGAPGHGEGYAVCIEDAGTSCLSQSVDADGNGSVDELVWQADFAPHETKRFLINRGPSAMVAARVGGRVVPERMDDFAWENDRIAFRMYGRRVEGHLVSSGVDVWCKRTPLPVIDRWYAKNDYHHDYGEGLDAYIVGAGRGCGGTAVVVDGALVGSRNWVAARVVTGGPIRFIFELYYEPWVAGGATVVERKRITLDAGQHLNRLESVFFTTAPEGRVTVAAGLAAPQGSTIRFEREAGWMRVWHPLADAGAGRLGVGLVLAGAPANFDERDGHALATREFAEGTGWVYYAGAGWEQAGFPDVDAWDAYLAAWAARLRAPLQIRFLPSEASLRPIVRKMGAEK